jgi:hypothetical protein
MTSTPPSGDGRFTLHLSDASDSLDPVGPPASALLEGPWVEAFWMEVPFPVRSKSNFRRHRRGDGDRWAQHATFADRLAELARAAVPGTWDIGDATAPLAQRPVVVAHLAAVTLLDTGNVDKSDLDAVEGIVYWNDASVRASSAATVRRRDGQRGWAAFARLEPGSSAAAVTDAHIALLTAWRDLGSPPLT